MGLIKRIGDSVARRWLGGVGIGYTGGDFYASRGMGFRQTSSGVPISEETAITIPAMFQALRLFAQTIGMLPWSLEQITESDRNGITYVNRSIAVRHPSHRLVRYEPNEFQVSSSFRETLVAHRFLYGAAFAYIEKNGNSRPTAMIPLLPDRTWPTRIGGVLQFVTIMNGSEQTLQPDEVFHLPGISLNGLTAVPLVKTMASTLGLTKAEEEWASAFFRNMMGMGGMLEVPGKLSPEARVRLKSSMAEQHAGLGNAFRWMLAEEGMKATPFPQVDAEKAQMIASRQYSLGDMARICGLAPHLLYDLSRSTNNNIEQQGIEAVNYSFAPVVNKLNEEANRKLLYESEKGAFEFTMDMSGLTRGSALEEAQRDQIRFNCASKTPNEIRAKDGLNPIDGGDELFVNISTLPLNLVVKKTLAGIEQANSAQQPLDADQLAGIVANAVKTAAGQSTDTPDPDDNAPPQGGDVYDDGPKVDPKEVGDVLPAGFSGRALAPVVRDVVGRLMRRECKAVGSAVDKHQDDPAALAAWLDAYLPQCRRTVADGLRSVCESLAALSPDAPDAEAVADQWMNETAADVRSLSPGSVSDDKELMIEGWLGIRTERIVSNLAGEQ